MNDDRTLTVIKDHLDEAQHSLGHIPANRIKAAWEFVPKSAHVNCRASVKL